MVIAVREVFMEQKMDNIKSTFMKELQQAELGVLLDLQKICDDNDIRFYLAFGTLIGCIRHKGFIPWDDDIDVVMFRDEFERFLSIVKNAPDSKYEIQYLREFPDYWAAHAKMRLKGRHKFVNSYIAYETENDGPFADIFILDYLPKRKDPRQSAVRRLTLLLRMILGIKASKNASKNIMRRMLIGLGKIMFKPFPISALSNTFIYLCKKWNECDRSYVLNYGSQLKLKSQIFPVSKFGEPQYVSFEGYFMPVPQDYDYILKTLYGDYMKLPPDKERQATHHWELREK
jgi:lipopolysaccharide cholinephosphotransferase